MNLTVSQKVKLFLIQITIKVVYFVDYLGNIPDRIAHLGLRTFLYSVLIISAITGVVVESSKSELGVESIFGNILQSSNVLGATSKIKVELVNEIPLPEITSRSVYAVDLESNEVLFSLNENLVLPPASTTKLMTALVARDLYSLNDSVVISNGCTETASQKIGLYSGETLLVSDLIHALLVNSAGDAACGLASYKVSYLSFVDLMNDKANTLGLSNTHFSNPVGLDSNNGDQVSTAYDLFLLSKAVISDRFLKDIVGIKEHTLTSGIELRNLVNTNDLLWDLPGTVGIKTGKTYAAGEVLSYEYKDETKDIVIIVMGSSDRFTDTRLVLEWILKSYNFSQ